MIHRLGDVGAWVRGPGMAGATVEAHGTRSTSGPILPGRSPMPTLIVHAHGEPVPVQDGRSLADHVLGRGLRSRAWTMRLVHPGSKTQDHDADGELPSPAAMQRHHSRIAPCAPCCSPISSHRHSTPAAAATAMACGIPRFDEIIERLAQQFEGRRRSKPRDGRPAPRQRPDASHPLRPRRVAHL